MKTRIQRIHAVLALAVFAAGTTGLARAATETTAPAVVAENAAADKKLTAGEVRKIDAEQGKLTIKHAAIDNLQMPAMTMVFKADKPELLKDLKAGDKIRFRAESVAGAFVVTDVQLAQ